MHSRFSTNTFPSWPLAHPYRYIAHNGEINTVQGNQNWMRAREAMASSPHLPNLDKAFPICTPGASDTARFDEVLELLHLAGRPIQHAILMMIPEAWENNAEMDDDKRAFYRFHASVMEPWDGPASVTFTDGTVIGAVLDRNGLRPSRYWVTDDDLVVMASEVGVIDIDPAKVVTKGRLQPGKMFLIDTAEGRIVDDEEIKGTLAAEHPYAEWLEQGMAELVDLPEREHVVFSHDSVLRRQQMFGYTHEELKIIVAPMALNGAEPIGSMGTDTPIAVLSERPRLLFDYFQQLFAQVTNPPLDAIREEVVTAVASTIGPEANLLQPGPENCRQLALPFPIIDNDELARIIHADDDGGYPGLKSHVVKGLYRVAGGGKALRCRARGDLRRGVAGDRPRRPGHRAVRPQRRRGRRADPVAAAHVGGAPPPRAHQAAHDGRPARRVRRRPRGPPHGVADRVRRRCDQPVPRVRVDRGPDRRRRGLAPRPRRDRSAQGGAQLHQGVRQGRAQGDVEDGRLDRRQLHRRPDLRGDRARRGADRAVLHRHREPARRDRPRRARRPRPPRATPPPTRRVPRSGPTASSSSAASTSGAARASTTCSTPRRCSSSSTRRGPSATTSSRSTRARRRPVAPPGDVARPVPLQTDDRSAIPIDEVEPVERDRPALLDRCDVVRVDLGRGARDAGDRDEPDRRQVEHR